MGLPALVLAALLLAQGDSTPTLHVTSPAFHDGDALPQRFTCYNALEPSPPIDWSSGPSGTRSYVVVMDAPERPGGVGVQWLVFNVPADVLGLAEDVPKVERLDNRAHQGTNDVGKIGFSAPCPPPNTTYTYRFSVYALDSFLDSGAADLQASIAGHVLAQGELLTTYLRPSWPWG